MATESPSTAERVGFVGLGIMGSRMAANLARAGHELTVFNRTRATAEAWVAEHGGAVADTPRRARPGARPAPVGATCSTASSCPRRRPASCSRATI